MMTVPVSEGSNDKAGRVAQVLIAIANGSVDHSDHYVIILPIISAQHNQCQRELKDISINQDKRTQSCMSRLSPRLGSALLKSYQCNQECGDGL